jgi:hypothetical protein
MVTEKKEKGCARGWEVVGRKGAVRVLIEAKGRKKKGIKKGNSYDFLTGGYHRGKEDSKVKADRQLF